MLQKLVSYLVLTDGHRCNRMKENTAWTLTVISYLVLLARLGLSQTAGIPHRFYSGKILVAHLCGYTHQEHVKWEDPGRGGRSWDVWLQQQGPKSNFHISKYYTLITQQTILILPTWLKMVSTNALKALLYKEVLVLESLIEQLLF